MSDDIAIKAENVSKFFVLPHEKTTSVKSAFTGLFAGRGRTVETQHALDDISFEVKRGEFFGIVGRNGSGKSTMLKILAGIYQPTQGSVKTYGKLVPFIELGVGFNAELSGRENVFLNGAMLGFSRKEMSAMYNEIVEFAELERFMDQKLKNYSSGMQVRLAFSLAIRAEADILLVDEVLAVGDADFQRKCFEYFKQLKRNKKTVVFVSHDMNAVREYCDRAVLVEKSKVVKEGSADEIAGLYSKMFIEENKKGSSKSSDSSKRWGSGDVLYKNIETKITDEKVTITLRATAHKDVEEPNFGFSLKDSSGQSLLGTNSFIKRQGVRSLKAGSKVELAWEFANILQDGEYTVEPAVIGSAGETWDWWEDAAKIQVKKAERTPYRVNPDINLKIDVK